MQTAHMQSVNTSYTHRLHILPSIGEVRHAGTPVILPHHRLLSFSSSTCALSHPCAFCLMSLSLCRQGGQTSTSQQAEANTPACAWTDSRALPGQWCVAPGAHSSHLVITVGTGSQAVPHISPCAVGPPRRPAVAPAASPAVQGTQRRIPAAGGAYSGVVHRRQIIQGMPGLTAAALNTSGARGTCPVLQVVPGTVLVGSDSTFPLAADYSVLPLCGRRLVSIPPQAACPSSFAADPAFPHQATAVLVVTPLGTAATAQPGSANAAGPVESAVQAAAGARRRPISMLSFLRNLSASAPPSSSPASTHPSVAASAQGPITPSQMAQLSTEPSQAAPSNVTRPGTAPASPPGTLCSVHSTCGSRGVSKLGRHSGRRGFEPAPKMLSPIQCGGVSCKPAANATQQDSGGEGAITVLAGAGATSLGRLLVKTTTPGEDVWWSSRTTEAGAGPWWEAEASAGTSIAWGTDACEEGPQPPASVEEPPWGGFCLHLVDLDASARSPQRLVMQETCSRLPGSSLSSKDDCPSHSLSFRGMPSRSSSPSLSFRSTPSHGFPDDVSPGSTLACGDLVDSGMPGSSILNTGMPSSGNTGSSMPCSGLVDGGLPDSRVCSTDTPSEAPQAFTFNAVSALPGVGAAGGTRASSEPVSSAQTEARVEGNMERPAKRKAACAVPPAALLKDLPESAEGECRGNDSKHPPSLLSTSRGKSQTTTKQFLNSQAISSFVFAYVLLGTALPQGLLETLLTSYTDQ